MDKIKILGFAGSLRKGSFNKSLLQAAAGLAPADSEVDIFDIKGIPFYNQDLEREPDPEVTAFKKAIREADALLIVTPEYNYSVPGVLKNAIDAASRPYGDNAFDGKPVAITGASISALGTARAQYHLRQMCVFLNMYPLNRPEVMVPKAQDKFDAEGNLIDIETKGRVLELMEALVDWARKLK